MNDVDYDKLFDTAIELMEGGMTEEEAFAQALRQVEPAAEPAAPAEPNFLYGVANRVGTNLGNIAKGVAASHPVGQMAGLFSAAGDAISARSLDPLKAINPVGEGARTAMQDRFTRGMQLSQEAYDRGGLSGMAASAGHGIDALAFGHLGLPISELTGGLERGGAEGWGDAITAGGMLLAPKAIKAGAWASRPVSGHLTGAANRLNPGRGAAQARIESGAMQAQHPRMSTILEQVERKRPLVAAQEAQASTLRAEGIQRLQELAATAAKRQQREFMANAVDRPNAHALAMAGDRAPVQNFTPPAVLGLEHANMPAVATQLAKDMRIAVGKDRMAPMQQARLASETSRADALRRQGIESRPHIGPREIDPLQLLDRLRTRGARRANAIERARLADWARRTGPTQ